MKKVEGSSYILFVLVVSLFTISILYLILGTIVNWTYDTMISNPAFNLDRRYTTVQQMLRLWNAIPIFVLLTAALYALNKTMREREF
jgi:type III secretory pathway component EscU